MFRQGQPLRLRTFSGTSVFEFTAMLLMVRYVPTAYLLLEYPRSVDATKMRTPQGEATLNIQAIIRTTVEGDDPGGVAHGVEFCNLRPIEFLALEGYVTHAHATIGAGGACSGADRRGSDGVNGAENHASQ